MNANFAYLAFGFRITPKWATSIGIAPYSSVGYNINTSKQVEGSTDTYNIDIEGSGGLNQFYWGNSYKITRKFLPQGIKCIIFIRQYFPYSEN
ncbi:MAG: hypothetical protein HC830_12885, partial [Bacteroidetes bacterium]|nr:hypothetical protein [Bacteroidota bacterium]